MSRLTAAQALQAMKTKFQLVPRTTPATMGPRNPPTLTIM